VANTENIVDRMSAALENNLSFESSSTNWLIRSLLPSQESVSVMAVGKFRVR
jgi:hypothetical protein